MPEPWGPFGFTSQLNRANKVQTRLKWIHVRQASYNTHPIQLMLTPGESHPFLLSFIIWKAFIKRDDPLDSWWQEALAAQYWIFFFINSSALLSEITKLGGERGLINQLMIQMATDTLLLIYWLWIARLSDLLLRNILILKGILTTVSWGYWRLLLKVTLFVLCMSWNALNKI